MHVALYAALVGLSTLCLGPVAAEAVPLLDTGTPDETGVVGVYYDPLFGSATFIAQEITFTGPVSITAIEAYVGGAAANAIQVDLTSAIGPGATAADLIASASLPLPGTPDFSMSGAWVSAPMNVLLAAGTYFLVFSPDFLAGSSGYLGSSFMPTDAPATLGDRFAAGDGMLPFVNVNLALPIASDFSLVNTFSPGIRIIPEPSTGLLLVGGVLGMAVGRRRRG
jgi:hypothetical protein